MTHSSPQNAAEKIEQETRAKYSGAFYSPHKIMHSGEEDEKEYFIRLDRLKRGWVRRYASGKRVLDLCCATAKHLQDIAPQTAEAVGLDFSLPFLRAAKTESAQKGLSNTRFLCGNARMLPFASGAFGVVYCFSSLYNVPGQTEVVGEISRVLEPGGIALFDMGNRCSLNEWVGRAHTETAAMCNLRVSEMRRMINEAGLEIVEHHALQILPFWGNKPKWLRPLLKPFWKNLFAKRIAGKMLDQWVCALPGFKHVAFRHFFICRKK